MLEPTSMYVCIAVEAEAMEERCLESSQFPGQWYTPQALSYVNESYASLPASPAQPEQ